MVVDSKPRLALFGGEKFQAVEAIGGVLLKPMGELNGGDIFFRVDSGHMGFAPPDSGG